MKQSITTLTLAFVILLTAVPLALAANGQAPENGCQPGANNHRVQGWQLFSRDEFADYLMGRGYPEENAVQQSIVTYAFCDHNNDGYACVMEQNLPNDASGYSSYWLAEDNHPFGG